MISTLKTQLKNSLSIALLFAISLLFFGVNTALAQTSLTLSVSPTIFEMSANPKQNWSSNIRVINQNPYEIRVFANVVNFAPQGEVGQGKFIPVSEDSDGSTIAEWVDITRDAIVVPPEQTIDVPFTVLVPENAPPGGHFAAIQIGTKPPDDPNQTVKVETSQIVTTLVFLRVEGDVIESGNIRAFRTTERLLEKPEATFELRFENKGNVHIQPQGEIKITNMWGQVRGIIPVNRDTLFGNVLPESVRKFSFTWTGDWSIADMGRYSAVATLAYGENSKQFTDSETSFWVIPWKVLTLVLIVITGFIMLFTWAIKLYIRKMLSMAGVTPVSGTGQPQPSINRRRVSVVAPIEAGMLDLRGQWQENTTFDERTKTVINFVKKYQVFFLVFMSVVVFLIGIYWYVHSASVSQRAYEVTIDGLSDEIKITSEEVEYQALKEGTNLNEKVLQNDDLPTINIVNRSGVSGLAAELRIMLEQAGYVVAEMQNDFGASEDNTVIVYDPDFTEEALALSQLVYGAPLSAFLETPEDAAPITVYVGKDLEFAVQ